MPLAIDLFCGLGGWTEGLLAEGYDVVGFDIERHRYPRAKPAPHIDDTGLKRPGLPPQMRGVAFNDSRHVQFDGSGEWMEYPAQLVLQDVLTLHGSQFRDAALIVASPPCQAYSYRAMPWKRAKSLPPPDNTLFDACFRIQREACEAAGRHVPMVVENVRGAQKWVGRARWNFGSFYLWGDVPALMPIVKREFKVGFNVACVRKVFHGDPNVTMEQARKNNGGSWFNIAHNTTSGKGRNPDGRKCGGDWFASGENCSLQRRQSSKGTARSAASALTAKIPLPLSRHIARVYACW